MKEIESRRKITSISLQDNPSVSNKVATAGITLVALVVTIVVLLILAGITLVYVFGDNGIFGQASKAKIQTEIAKARERLEIVLGSAKIEKHTNSKYNENEYLDEYIISQIKEVEIIDDIVIVDGYTFELDRSAPKIGEYLGKKEELVFPELNISELVLATDKKMASFTITAREKENGISKIEILQEGHVIKTYEYDNEKNEINETYIAKQNGKYIVRVYAKYSISKSIDVQVIISSVDFEPNGNEEYKKEHSTKIITNETIDKIVSIKYQWTNSTVEPLEETFQNICQNGDTITKNGVTGTYYLWTLVRTESGKTGIWRSEKFNFDNQAPIITSFTATKYSETGITLSATARDTGTGIVKFEFYIDNVLKETQSCSATTSSVTKSKTITGLSTGSHNCKVVAYDAENNSSNKTVLGTTKLYAWEKWDVKETRKYKINEVPDNDTKYSLGNNTRIYRAALNEETGKFYWHEQTSTSYWTTNINNWTTSEIGSYWIKYSTGGEYAYRYWGTMEDGSGETAFRRYSSVAEVTYSKGTTSYGVTTATSSTAYPANGYKNGYKIY